MTNANILQKLNDIQFDMTSPIKLNAEDRVVLSEAKNQVMSQIFRQKCRDLANESLDQDEIYHQTIQLYDFATAKSKVQASAAIKGFTTTHDFAVRQLLFISDRQICIVFANFLYKPLRARSIVLSAIQSISGDPQEANVVMKINTSDQTDYQIEITDKEWQAFKSAVHPLEKFKIMEATFKSLDLSTDSATASANLAEIVGSKALYYSLAWERYEQATIFKGFNVSAFFLGGLWALYRKMHILALLALAIPGTLLAIDKTLGLFTFLACALILGTFGNAIYYKRVNRIAKTDAQGVLKSHVKGVYTQLPYILVLVLALLYIGFVMVPNLMANM